MGAEVKLVFHTKEVIKSIEHVASQKMYEATNKVRNVVLDTLSGRRTGRIYNVPNTKKKYTASAPGEPPAQATARLRGSVKAKVMSKGREVIGVVGTLLDYGKMLEYGTINMAPRPWLRISFEKALPKIKSILGGEWLK